MAGPKFREWFLHFALGASKRSAAVPFQLPLLGCLHSQDTKLSSATQLNSIIVISWRASAPPVPARAIRLEGPWLHQGPWLLVQQPLPPTAQVMRFVTAHGLICTPPSRASARSCWCCSRTRARCWCCTCLTGKPMREMWTRRNAEDIICANTCVCVSTHV